MTDSIGHFFRLPAPLAGVQIGALLSHSSGIPDHYAFTDTIKVRHATDRDVLRCPSAGRSFIFYTGYALPL